MNKTIALLKAGFESSCGETDEFKKFVTTFKREFTAELNSIGATNIEIRKGHFEVSGYYTIGTQAWYFSLCDVRGMGLIHGVDGFSLMYRKCKDYKDSSGGSNQWVQIVKGMGYLMQ